jgi:hypothetical protein
MLPLLLALLLGVSGAQGDLRQLQKQEEARHHEREVAIARELETLRDHPWAAAYGSSNGMGIDTVALAPRGGAAFGSPGCLGLMNLNHGEIQKSGADWVQVAWKIDPALDTFDYLGKRQPRLGSKLLVIPWDKEHYLVPEGRLMEFVNAVNARDKILVSSFWRRGPVQLIGIPELPGGQPELPEPLRSCLLTAAVTCRCTSAHDSPEPHSSAVQHLWRSAEIDAGALQKLHVGMCLYGGSKELAGEVVEVSEHSATVEFRSLKTDAQRRSIKQGTELTTRPPGN